MESSSTSMHKSEAPVDNFDGGILENDSESQGVLKNSDLKSFIQGAHEKYDPVNYEVESQNFSTDLLYLSKRCPVHITDSGSIILPGNSTLSGQDISRAGDSDEIRKMCKRVTDLDLMDNKIQSWAEVFSIIECIPSLICLNLSKNPLNFDPHDIKGQDFPHLKKLVLNSVPGLTWETIRALLGCFTGLQELHLSLNGFQSFDLQLCPSASNGASELYTQQSSDSLNSHEELCPQREASLPLEEAGKQQQPLRESLEGAAFARTDMSGPQKRHGSIQETGKTQEEEEDPDSNISSTALSAKHCEVPTKNISCYPSLRRLYFVGNKIMNWAEFNKLGSFFPSLESLILSDSEISRIDDEKEIAKCFPCLKCLALSRCALESWAEVEKLHHFPVLVDLRISGNPFLEGFPAQMQRQHAIALLQNITELNGSRISAGEREDAERAFIRFYMDKEVKGQRYYELESRYGRLDPLVDLNLKPDLKVIVTVKVEDFDGKLIKSEEMEIDTTQTIRQLRKLLSNMTDTPVAKIQLFHLETAGSSGLERLLYLDRKVFACNVRSGDEIVVAPKM